MSAVDTEPSFLGLTSEDVQDRRDAGQSNFTPRSTSRPFTQILRANIFTTFNGILSVALVLVLALGDWRDALFGLVMVFNSAIGVFSEVRAKRTLDSVAVLQAPQSRVLRDGEWVDLPSDDLVLDDVVALRLGDQIPADGELLSVKGLEVDESALTGESVPVAKSVGDDVQSATAVVAGSGVMITRRIGADAWAQQITSEAKQFSLAVSEIQSSVNKILRAITWMIPFVLALLIWSQLRVEGNDWQAAVVLAVAGIVGIIPQGLVLLTSLNFGIAAATLARRNVLVQELPAVEILARVDRLCLDKTGTLTTGGIRGQKIIFSPDGEDPDDALGALHLLTDGDGNASSTAIKELLGRSTETPTAFPADAFSTIPFSSSRKWSALVGTAAGSHLGTWVLGAPEVVLEEEGSRAQWADQAVSEASNRGQRTICLAHSAHLMQGQVLPAQLRVIAIIVMSEDIRPDAAEILKYFREQGVGVRVISGDAPATVAAIARQVGLGDGETPIRVIDARHLPDPTDPQFDQMVADAQVFGRVRPDQKRDIVASMRAQGHTVAMTGDGVNDALALKKADLGIAMGNGAPATKAVSRLVLLDGEFGVLPGVVAEGRRIMANMERVSALFLSKTAYTLLLAVIVSVAGLMYPFLPRQLTYIGWFTIGIPAFVLALAPNRQRYRAGFLRRTLLVSVPTGVIIGLGAVGSYLAVGAGTTPGQTAVTLTCIITGLWLVGITARPFNWWRGALLGTMAVGAVLGVLIVPIRHFFALDWPTGSQWLAIGLIAGAACLLIELSYRVTARWRNQTPTAASPQLEAGTS